jgi:nucleoporin NUP82
LFEVLDSLRPQDGFDEEWPTFSLDPCSRYSFFVNNMEGIVFFSLDPWLETVEKEFQNTSTDGTEFRMKVLKNGPETFREPILHLQGPEPGGSSSQTTACVVLEDSDLGYFLLTCAGEQPHAVIFDQPDVATLDLLSFKDDEEYQFHQDMTTLGPMRSAYQPPASFWTPSSLTTFFSKQVPARHRKALKEEIRLSTNTLDLMTEAHRILSQETHQLGLAAADLFRRCERLQDELRDQIKRTAEAAQRIEEVIGENGDDYDVAEGTSKGKIRVDERLQNALSKQRELMDRHEHLRKDVAKKLAARLSEKEEQWVSEIDKMSKLVLGDDRKDDDEDGGEAEDEKETPKKPWQRYQEVCYTYHFYSEPHAYKILDSIPQTKLLTNSMTQNQAKTLSQDLITRAKQLAAENRSNQTDIQAGLRIPSELRKAKVDEVSRLLDREYVCPFLSSLPLPLLVILGGTSLYIPVPIRIIVRDFMLV